MRPLPLLRAAFVAIATTVGLHAQSPIYPTQIYFYRLPYYSQTNATATTPTSAAWSVAGTFAAGLPNLAQLAIITPAGERLLLPVSSNGTFGGEETFTSPAALYAAAPDGIYNLELSGANQGSSLTTFTVSGANSVVPVTVTNFTALQSWTASDVTVNWTNPGTTTGDLLYFGAEDLSGDSLAVLSSVSSTLAVNATSGVLTGLPKLSTYFDYIQVYKNLASTVNSGATHVSVYNGAETYFDVIRGTVAKPVIATQPAGGTVPPGSTFIFSVGVSGASDPSLSYQWSKNGTPITGATSASLEIPGAQAGDAGNYAVAVTNAGGTATSSAASLSVAASANPGRIINLSIRTVAGTGSQVLSAGFFIGGAPGNGTQAVLVRGIGPTLGSFGLGGTLVDPALQLFAQPPGATPVATNDDWGVAAQAAQINTVSAQVGAFSLAPGSKDAALYLPTLASGGYSAVIAGNNNGTGVALAEVYDATPAGAYTASMPHLVNVSGKSQVGTGANALFGGFTIGGATSKTLLIRASGPALTPFGITGVLAAPQLDLFNQADTTTPIATNVGWGGDPNIIAAATAVSAFPWNNGRSADSALLVTLPQGGYSVEVSGVGSTTGIALLEIYELP